MEAANWNGPNIQRTSTRLGAAHRGLRALREGPRARAGDGRARSSPRELMLELTGARLCRGTIDVGGPGPEPRDDPPARRARRAAAGHAPIPRAEQARILEALGSASPTAEDGLDVTVPAFRRNDVTREADLSRRSRACAAWRSCPPRCRRAAAPAAG